MTLVVKMCFFLFTPRHERMLKHRVCPVYLPQAFIVKQLYCFPNTKMNNGLDICILFRVKPTALNTSASKATVEQCGAMSQLCR